jgi:hypothetical protein
MKYIKSFEKVKSESDDSLFDCVKFRIIHSNNDSFSMQLKHGNLIMREFSAIPGMAELIRDDAKEIINPNLRKIKIRPKDINEEIKALTLDEEKIKNIKQFRTGYMKHFLEETVRRSLTEDTYMDLVFKYYPIILDAIKKSKTLGDLIDNFLIIYPQLKHDTKEFSRLRKYNIAL